MLSNDWHPFRENPSVCMQRNVDETSSIWSCRSGLTTVLMKFETVYHVVHWQKVRTGDRTLSRAILNKKNSVTVRILSRATARNSRGTQRQCVFYVTRSGGKSCERRNVDGFHCHGECRVLSLLASRKGTRKIAWGIWQPVLLLRLPSLFYSTSRRLRRIRAVWTTSLCLPSCWIVSQLLRIKATSHLPL